MVRIRFLTIATVSVALAIVACDDSGLHSDEQSDQIATANLTIPDEILPLLNEWSQCLSVETPKLASDLRPTAELVEALYAACDEQAKLVDEAASAGGLVDDSLMDYVKKQNFDRTARTIDSLRNGTPPPTPEGYWGACIAAQIRAISNDVVAQEAAATALDACVSFEEVVRIDAANRLGDAFAEQYVGELRRSLLHQAIVMRGG